jgi:hypothetical protein
VDIPSTNEHSDRLRRSLDGSRNAHDGGTEEDRGPSAQTISDIGRKGVRSQ